MINKNKISIAGREYPDPRHGLSLYSDSEWAQVQLAWALIGGYKAHKGEAGYDEDYRSGKGILDNVRNGVYLSCPQENQNQRVERRY